MNNTSKDLIRKEAIKKRDNLNAEYRKEESKKVLSQLYETRCYKKADIVFSYASFNSELETIELNNRVLEDKKELYLPKTIVKDKKIVFYKIEDLKKDLKVGYQGILEPDIEKDLKFIEQEELLRQTKNILIVMPGTAFDRKGFRMGYGGGYYDRFLEKINKENIKTIMLAFKEQFIEDTYSKEYDIKPDKILTN